MPKTVVVTGGTKGIGASIVEYFIERGDKVLVAARNDNGFASGLGPNARFCMCDVTVPADHDKLVDIALEWTGRLDVYINNAGRSGWRSLEHVTEAFLHEMFSVNAASVVYGCRSAARVLKPGACIINISSLAGKRGSANNSVYCATKFAVNGITQSLAKELGPKGIRVNAVCPVLVNTPGLLGALSEEASPAMGNPETFLKTFEKTNAALPKLPTGQQVAEFCYAIATCSALTGQCVNLDAGVFPQ